MSRVWKYLHPLFVAALITGCALHGGTEAGNPTIQNTATNEPIPGQFAQYLLDTVCVKYHECYPAASTESCAAGLLEQTNLAGGFGLSTGFGTARDMVNAERLGTIQPDATLFANCVADLRRLSCASASVGTAAPTGSTNVPSSYSGVINMIPTSGTSCAGVF